jgi:hypothetical protein
MCKTGLRSMFCLALLASAPSWAASGDGMMADAESLLGPRLQTRLAVGSAVPAWRAGLDSSRGGGLSVDAISLMGDYYFRRIATEEGTAHGFRASSGVFFGPRQELSLSGPRWAPAGRAYSIDRRQHVTDPGLTDANPETATLPYLGVGYSSLSRKTGWSLSADLGLVALYPGNAVRLGRVLGGAQALDEVLRDLRIAPVLQFGVTYAF